MVLSPDIFFIMNHELCNMMSTIVIPPHFLIILVLRCTLMSLNDALNFAASII